MAKETKGKVKQMKAKPIYDPSKNYQWQKEDIFTITGIDLQILYHTLKEMALTPAGTAPANIVASYEIMNKLIVSSVESGLITEAPTGN